MSNFDEPLKVHRYKCHLCGEVYSTFALACKCIRICREKRNVEKAIANGTIAEAEAAEDEAEQASTIVADRVSEDVPAEETLDDPLIPVMDWVNWILSSESVRLDEYSERTGRLCLGILRNQILLHKHSVTLRVPISSAIDVGIQDALEAGLAAVKKALP